MKRMEIYWVRLDGGKNIQGGHRPCLVVCNDKACTYSPTVIVVPITSAKKKLMPTHLDIDCLHTPSTILFEQLITVNKEQVDELITELPDNLKNEAEERIKISLGLTPMFA